MMNFKEIVRAKNKQLNHNPLLKVNEKKVLITIAEQTS